MKKKGFTLIELLAVIIILAIIALIATPIIMRVIENSKKGAAERSAENYVRAVETQVIALRANGTTLENGLYRVRENGNLCPDNEECNEEKEIKIEMNGNKPSGGIITISDNKIIFTGVNLVIGEYTIGLSSEGNAKESICAVTIESTKTTGTEPTGEYNYGDEYICNVDGTNYYHFFVLENGDTTPLTKDETGTSGPGEISLIMNMNIGKKVAWCGDASLCKTNGNWDNTKTAITANQYLASETSNWIVNAYLPTSQQIKSAYKGNMPIWLYDYLSDTVHPIKNLTGYWTSSYKSGTTNQALYVHNTGYVYGYDIDDKWDFGVRPVITISKTQLN